MTMKKTFFALLIALLTLPTTMNAQNYAQLWNQASKAEREDLPQTQAKVLEKIIAKAEKEQAYGQLLKAALTHAQAMASIAPDSLEPAVKRLEQREQQAKSLPLKAVYEVVLGQLYNENPSLADDAKDIAQRYFTQAMSHPVELAATKAGDYKPFVIEGHDSHYYADDLLSVIAQESNQYAALHAYYLTTGNRQAQLFSALEMLRQQRPDERVKPAESAFLQRLDSLAERYADLAEAGEVALLRYSHLDENTTATAEEKISYIDTALSRWGSWKRMNELRNAKTDLTSSRFTVQIDQEVWMPNRQQKIDLKSMRNITQLTMKVYGVKAEGDIELSPALSEQYKKIKNLLKPMPQLTKTLQLGTHHDYDMFEDSTVIEALPAGVYMLEFESKPATTSPVRMLYFVSDVRLLQQKLPGQQIRYATVNATTGQPIPGASIRLTIGYGSKQKRVVVSTNANGEHLYTIKDKQQPSTAFAYTQADKACRPYNGYGYFSCQEHDRSSEQAVVYTDRAIYRPGQQVHVAAIFYSTEHYIEHQALPHKKVTMRLYDANYEVVAEQEVTTDEYGTCTADFTLPKTGLTGRFSVAVNGFAQWFRVEEYKRPTFQVEFDEVKQSYDSGDTISVKATARSYAGVPIQGAKVSYKVVRRRAFWWMSYSRYWSTAVFGQSNDDEELAAGEAMTEGDGTFSVDVPLTVPTTKYPMFYNFVVTADVTDQAGETHQGQYSLPLGNRKTALSVDLADKVLAEDKGNMTFHLRNAAGNDISAKVRYRIDNGKWQNADTQQPIAINEKKSGRHTLTAICQNDTVKRDFVVFSLNDKRPAAETDDWFYVSDFAFPPNGKPVTVQVGSSASNVHILYTVISGDRLLESGVTDKSNELINRKLAYKEEYGNGLLLTYVWMREGKVYEHTVTLQKPLPDKNLKLQWKTFRDRLTPGQQEEWTLVVTKPDGTPANAQLMATLYDKSLEQLAPLNWHLAPSMWLPLPSTQWQFDTWGSAFGQAFLRPQMLKVSALSFSRFDHDIYPHYIRYAGFGAFRTRNIGMAYSRAGAVTEEAVLYEAPVMMSQKSANAADTKLQGRIGGLDVKGNDEADSAQGSEAESQQASEPQLRENLQETAFFYPQLTADSTGCVALKFTLPESLTTWHFMGIAHTKDMMHGMLEGDAVAKKDVMIQPNMPRFVREGDVATISARVFNTSEQTVSGTARLQLVDPETDAVVYEQSRQVSVEANQTGSVSFEYKPDGQQQLLIARMSISGEGYSDGEQHYLPILPNREQVTVTVPFTQTKPGTKTIDLSQLVPVAQGKLTIEYTNNPVWLMIQALPAVGHPHDDCAICQATSYYANALGRHIIKQNPRAKGVFEQWKREDTSVTSLSSQLEKNTELKDLLLNETPWVLDADRESEQRQRLADFFDENLMQQRLSSAIEKMGKLQNSDGSWSWWPGMHGSTYMTVSISEMLVRLNHMTDEQSETTAMLKKAFSFMNKEMVEMVKEMKRQEKKGMRQSFPSFTALQYLYICTIDGRKQDAETTEAQNYLKKLLKKERKNQSIYEKALSAIILNAPLYVKSLKEYTVYREEMGRYYDTPRAGYSWRDYRIPTQTMAIEAIQRLTPQDTATISEMQRWLLQEKHTQAWDTPINSVDAVYAFMNGNSQALAPQPATRLAIDGKELETSKATAGIGYVKTALPAQGAKTFTAEKTSEGTSWGAVYAQFMQKTSDVKDQTESGIVVKRELLTTAGKAVNSPLKVGDRVKVRITITTDRDLDFVQVTDRRAACMEPVNQLSGYHWGYYCAPRDQSTNFYYDVLPKGKHVLETEYYIDREGEYQTGTCSVQCAYAPAFKGLTKSRTIIVK